MSEEKKSLEQVRAEHALNEVKEVQKERYAGKFRSYVERLPAAIIMNGLGQAMASELAAAGRAENDDRLAHKRLYECVEKWIRCRRIYNQENLMDAIVKGSQEQYVLAQAEALAYLEWLKKFSQAFLKGEGDGSQTSL